MKSTESSTTPNYPFSSQTTITATSSRMQPSIEQQCLQVIQENRQKRPNRSPLQMHCDFFDRNKDGLLTPWETFEGTHQINNYLGFRSLGYNIFMCIYVTIVIHVFLGWLTQDSWIPDPFFTVNLKRIDRALHGSDSKVYDQKGELVISQLVNTLRMTSREYINTLMTPEDVNLDQGYLTFWEGWKLTQKNWDAWDFFGWWANKIEWFF